MKSIYFLVILLLIGCGCVPGEGDDSTTYYIPDEFKAYIIFPKGSYWIYEEANTKEIDSVYIYRSESNIENGASKLGYNYEKYTSGYKSSLSEQDSVRGFGYPDLNDQNLFVYEEFRLNDFTNAPYTFFSGGSIAQTIKYTSDFAIQYESFYTSLKIEDDTYQNVKVFHHNINYFSYQSERIYFAENIGIIKRELFNGQTWQLKRYHIN